MIHWNLYAFRARIAFELIRALYLSPCFPHTHSFCFCLHFLFIYWKARIKGKDDEEEVLYPRAHIHWTNSEVTKKNKILYSLLLFQLAYTTNKNAKNTQKRRQSESSNAELLVFVHLSSTSSEREKAGEEGRDRATTILKNVTKSFRKGFSPFSFSMSLKSERWKWM